MPTGNPPSRRLDRGANDSGRDTDRVTAQGGSPLGRPPSHTPPRTVVRAIGWLMAAWCAGFAVVNIVFESTGHFAGGEYAEYAAAFTVMNWLVVGLKLLGAAIALLSVTNRGSPLPPRLLGMLVWSVFATLAVYALGSAVQALGIVLGLMGNADQIGFKGVAYVAFFLIAASGWAVLAVSYSRRHSLGRGPAALGAIAAPLVLVFLLSVMPALLRILGLMPSP